MEQRRRVREGDPVGDRGQPIGRHDDPIGVGAALTGVADNRPAGQASLNAVADGTHRASDTGARHVGRLQREPVAPLPAPHCRIQEQHGHDGNVDDDLPGARHGIRTDPEPQHLGAAEPRDLHHAHPAHATTRSSFSPDTAMTPSRSASVMLGRTARPHHRRAPDAW